MPPASSPTAALILIGGTLMLTPGFVSDAVGRAADPARHPAGGAGAADRVVAAPAAGPLGGCRPAGPAAPETYDAPDPPRGAGGPGRGRRRRLGTSGAVS